MNGISAFGSKDGLRTYTWDAENRLSSMAMDGNAGYATRIKLDFLYDSENRRVSKAVSTTTSQVVSPTWTLQSTTRFLYDGWNMIAQYSFASNVFTAQAQYVWGLDVNGSSAIALATAGAMQSAGGVGALLQAKVIDTVNSTTTQCLPCYDGNGNIMAWVDGSNSALIERREYDSFGSMVSIYRLATNATLHGRLAYGFSTKWRDAESDLLYYGHRYYNPSTQRWLNRDLIEEQGGINLYGFVGNDGVNQWDLLGMEVVVCGEIDDFLADNGVSNYTKEEFNYGTLKPFGTADGKYYKYSGSALSDNALQSEILQKMIGSGRVFEPKDGKQENLIAHVNQRIKIVQNAKFLAPRLKWYTDKNVPMIPIGPGKNPKTGVGATDMLADAMKNPQNFSAECFRASWIAMRDSGSLNISTTSDDIQDWIPGDWGYITNTTWVADMPGVSEAQGGQNLIYIGGGLFWGHGSNTQFISGDEWWNEVNGWHPKNGASLDKKRAGPGLPLMRVSNGINNSLTPTINTSKMKMRQ